MSDFEIEDLERRMQGAITVFVEELQGLRTGRASVGLLEPIVVEAYGSSTPLNQVASISAPEPRHPLSLPSCCAQNIKLHHVGRRGEVRVAGFRRCRFVPD